LQLLYLDRLIPIAGPLVALMSPWCRARPVSVNHGTRSAAVRINLVSIYHETILWHSVLHTLRKQRSDREAHPAPCHGLSRMLECPVRFPFHCSGLRRFFLV